MDICGPFSVETFILRVFPLPERPRHDAIRHAFPYPNLCCTVKRDVTEANYISQLSETDVQYNPVSANRHTFKQE